MSFFAKLVSIVFLAVALAGPAKADPDFEMQAKGMTLSDMIGRTMVGVTRDSSNVFSMHLARDGTAHFTSASGKTQTGRWRRLDSVIVCIKGLVPERPQEEVCKRAPETGRGLDWMTVTLETKNGKTTWAKATRDEHRGSSQMVWSFAGNVAVNRKSYVPDVTKWPGHIIVGRTLKDREAWSAKLDPGGAVDFVFASGRRFQGRYTVKAGEICLTFPQNPAADGCRRPTVKDRKVLWASSKDGAASSEIVFMHPVAKAPAPVAPPAPQGPPNRPHEALVMAQNGQGMYWPSPDRTLLAATNRGKDELVLWDTATGMRIGAFPGIANLSDLAWSPDGTRLAVVAPNGTELFDVASGRFLGAVPRASGMSDMTAAALMPDGRLVVGTAAGEVLHIAPGDGTVQRSLPLQAGGITDLAALPDGRLGVATVNGRIVVLDQNGNPSPGLDTRIGDRPGRLEVTADGRWMVTSGADGRLHLLDLSPGAMTPVRSNRLVQGKITQADVSADGRLLTMAFDTKGFAIASLPDLTGLQTFADKTDRVTRVTLLPGSPSLAVADTRGRLAIWVPDAAAARALATRSQQSGSPERQAAGKRQSAFALGRNESDAQQKAATARMKAAFDRGDCAAVDRDRPLVRLADQPGDCRAAAERRALERQYRSALDTLDCDAAAGLAARLGRKPAETDACRRKVQQAEDRRRFDTALAAGDCEAVRALAPAVKKPQAGADCDLAAALAADSPRRMFLAAVRFDTAGDLPRARRLYDAVMAKFPDDDLALDAARRLTQLADMDKQKAAADTQAAAQAAAVKAAEERAKAAEAAARKAADEAERQRKAREEEARRADAARREAEAAAAAAAAARQQPTRDTRCDHVYVGKEFKWETRGIFGKGTAYMRVVGVSQFSGQATVRNTSTGFTQETSCYSIP